MRAETYLVVVGALGALSWGGAAELAWLGVNTPPLIVRGGYFELTRLACTCPIRDSMCSGGFWLSRTYSRVTQQSTFRGRFSDVGYFSVEGQSRLNVLITGVSGGAACGTKRPHLLEIRGRTDKN